MLMRFFFHSDCFIILSFSIYSTTSLRLWPDETDNISLANVIDGHVQRLKPSAESGRRHARLLREDVFWLTRRFWKTASSAGWRDSRSANKERAKTLFVFFSILFWQSQTGFKFTPIYLGLDWENQNFLSAPFYHHCSLTRYANGYGWSLLSSLWSHFLFWWFLFHNHVNLDSRNFFVCFNEPSEPDF